MALKHFMWGQGRTQEIGFGGGGGWGAGAGVGFNVKEISWEGETVKK